MARFPSGPFGHSGNQPIEYESRVGDAAIAHFFNAVYAWMAAGLATTALVAWLVAHNGQAMAMLRGPALLVLFIAELALVVTISAAVNRISAGVATALFLLYSAINGVLFAVLFYVYTATSIGGVFLVTVAMFGGMSLYGFFTRRNLTNLGGLLFMALIGLIVASVVSMFWANSTLYWLINYAGVLIFVGLTAVDTQKLKVMAIQTSGDARLAARLSVNGALMLYLDFVNLFLFLLRILGNRRQ